MLDRFGDLGSLEETLCQRIDYVPDLEAGLQLRPSPLEGHWDQTRSVTSRRTKQMMLSTITMAIGDAEADWLAAEQLLG